jgi:hypothetical protein
MDDFGSSRTIHTVRWPVLADKIRCLNPIDYYGSMYNRKAIKNRIDQVSEILRLWLSPIVDVSDFAYSYQTCGTHDSINQWLASENRPVYCLKGEYPYLTHLSTRVLIVDNINQIPPNAVVYISNPFSATGKYDHRYQDITQPVILDCAYIGTTALTKVFVTPNTEQIFWSASKPFGFGNYRIGFKFTRNRDILQDNLKDTGYCNWFGLEILEIALSTFSITDPFTLLYDRYVQLCDRNGLQCSDSYLIALTDNANYGHFTREDGTIRVPAGRILDNMWRI